MFAIEMAWALMRIEKRIQMNLIRLMQEHDISGSELARILDMSPTDVSRWVKGKICPRVQTLGVICDVMGWDPAELLKPYSGEPPPQKRELSHAEIVRSVGTAVEAAGFKRPRLISKKKSEKSR